MTKVGETLAALSKNLQKLAERAVPEGEEGPVIDVLRASSPYGYPKDWISYPNLAMNLASGGGIPTGRFSAMAGEKSSGKTLVALHLAAETQRRGGVVIWGDSENSFNRFWAEGLGVNCDEILYIPPGLTLESYLQLFDDALSGLHAMAGGKEALTLVIFDSLSNPETMEEREKEMGASTMGGASRAKIIAQGIRKLTPKVSKTNTAFFVIQQVRQNIGGGLYSPEFTFPGGEALNHILSCQLVLSPRKKLFKEPSTIKKEIGTTAEFYVDKTRFCRPHRRVTFKVFWDKGDGALDEAGNARLGVDYYSGLMETLISEGIIPEPKMGKVDLGDKKYSCTDNHYGAKDLIRDHPEVIEKAIKLMHPTKQEKPVKKVEVKPKIEPAAKLDEPPNPNS